MSTTEGTAEAIPEPTGLGAVVRLEDGTLVVRVNRGAPPWRGVDDDWSAWGTWDMVIDFHGPAVAVLSPGWDEAK